VKTKAKRSSLSQDKWIESIATLMKVSQGMHDWWLIITKEGHCDPPKIKHPQQHQWQGKSSSSQIYAKNTGTNTNAWLAVLCLCEMQHVIHCPSSASVTALLCNTMAHINAAAGGGKVGRVLQKTLRLSDTQRSFPEKNTRKAGSSFAKTNSSLKCPKLKAISWKYNTSLQDSRAFSKAFLQRHQCNS